MLIDDLPRLTDEERDALDGGYIAMEGALCERCEGSGNAPSRHASEPLPPISKPRFRLVNIFVAIVGALALTACSMTPTQKKWTGFAAGVLIVGAIAAHDADNGTSITSPDVRTPTVPCSNPESCR